MHSAELLLRRVLRSRPSLLAPLPPLSARASCSTSSSTCTSRAWLRTDRSNSLTCSARSPERRQRALRARTPVQPAPRPLRQVPVLVVARAAGQALQARANLRRRAVQGVSRAPAVAEAFSARRPGSQVIGTDERSIFMRSLNSWCCVALAEYDTKRGATERKAEAARQAAHRKTADSKVGAGRPSG